MTMAVVATASATETEMKTAAAAMEGKMAGCDGQTGKNRVDESENNDGNKGAIGRQRGGMPRHVLPDLVGGWWWMGGVV